jgi:anti-anti-sigma factor
MKSEGSNRIATVRNAERGVIVVRLAGPEYGSLDPQKLARARQFLLDMAGKADPPYLIVDLSAVHFLGASFIGILMDTWDQLRQCSRRLILCGLTPYCNKLIGTMHLDKLFEIYPTQPIALERIGRQAYSGNGGAQSSAIGVQKGAVGNQRRRGGQ